MPAGSKSQRRLRLEVHGIGLEFLDHARDACAGGEREADLGIGRAGHGGEAFAA